MDNKKYPSIDEAYEIFAKAIDELPCSNSENFKQSGKNNIFASGNFPYI